MHSLKNLTPKYNSSHERLSCTVINNGFCVGCGVCAAPDQSPFKIIMDDYGQFQATLKDENHLSPNNLDYEKLCPFGSGAPNEDEIAKQYFSEICEHNKHIGYFNGVLAGHVAEGEFRKKGSSGGMGTWMLSELLSKGMVDYVLNVKSETANEDVNNIPFKYQVSETLDAVQQGSKSRYYPIDLSNVLNTVRKKPGRYAVVGLPCFIKSLRLLQAQEPLLLERIQYCIGLVCGQLKSTHYAESLAWQMGIPPQELVGIDFRMKDSTQPANRYDTYAKGRHNEKTVPTNQLFGVDWGAGAFKYKACDFCDDVFAETADAVLGDAWLEEYIQDSNGTNLVVTRNSKILELITMARNEGRLKLDDLEADKAVQSQEAALRHRKENIGYRIYCEQAATNWVPTKRIGPTKTLNQRYEMKRQRVRAKLRVLSHESFLKAKKNGQLSDYLCVLKPVYSRYTRQEYSYLRKLISFSYRKFKALLVH